MSVRHSGKQAAPVRQCAKNPTSKPISVAFGYEDRSCRTTEGPTYPMFPVTRIFISAPVRSIGPAESPNFPRGFPVLPQFLENVLLLQGVHAGPESAVRVSHQLPVAGKHFQGVPFPYGLVSPDIIQCPAFQDEEAAVDPPLVRFRLLVEHGNQVVIKDDSPESARGQDGRNRGQFPVGTVEFEKVSYFHVAEPVSVGQHEGPVLPQPLLQALDPSPRLGVQSRVDNVDFPVRLFPVVYDGKQPDWKVHIVDTGLHTQTGGGIKRVEEWLGGDRP